MASCTFADIDLARALEGAEAASSRAFCDAAAALYPHLPIRAIACAGGHALFYGPGDPLNAVKGVGLNGPVDPAEWAAMEDFHRSTGSPVVVDFCPLGDMALFTLLADRGYRIGSFETVTYRTLDEGPFAEPVLAPGMTISVVGPDNADRWQRVVSLGFADGGEPTQFAVDFGKVRARLPHSIMLLASVDGEPAGGAGLSIHRSELTGGPGTAGVAHMAGAAVLPAFRGRGIQSALTAARLRIARDHGCTLAKLDVQAGSVSHRNATRAGFQIAYTRPQMIKSW
jgi:GNAT superfamily N-acetyltransferase